MNQLSLISSAPNPLACVIEADEFDCLFLTLHPDVVIVTPTDADQFRYLRETTISVLESLECMSDKLKEGGHRSAKKASELENSRKANSAEFSLDGGQYHVVTFALKCRDGI